MELHFQVLLRLVTIFSISFSRSDFFLASKYVSLGTRGICDLIPKPLDAPPAASAFSFSFSASSQLGQ
jgi:hypothetical protein